MSAGPHYKENDNDRALAVQMAEVGISHKQIAAVLKISVDTLTRNYSDELNAAKAIANAAVAGKLYQEAINGNVTCMIFWLKTQAQWQEVMKIEQKVESEVTFRISAQTMTERDWEREYAKYELEDSMGTAAGAANGIGYLPTE